MQQEENKTVDIDTTGPSMDVDIAEEKDQTEVEQPEVKEEPTVRPVVEESAQTEAEPEKVEAKEETPKEEDELKQYSEGVQKRIAKLTKKWREAERQKDEALTYAERVMLDKKKADEKLSKLRTWIFKIYRRIYYIWTRICKSKISCC
jgi:hypothetical protein